MRNSASEPESGPGKPAREEVEIWSEWLDVSAEIQRSFEALLSGDERERAGQYRFEKHRNRFVVGRGFLRRILGQYLQIDPTQVRFEYSPEGKPALADVCGDRALHFNLAHSEDLAVLAVTRIGPVGADVERIRLFPNAADIVERFFSPREIARYMQFSDADKAAAFFELWTRKEAMLKATGEGIVGALNRVEVTFGNGEEARVLGLPGGSQDPDEWRLHSLSPAPGFVGAVGVRAPSASFVCRGCAASTR